MDDALWQELELMGDQDACLASQDAAYALAHEPLADVGIDSREWVVQEVDIGVAVHGASKTV